jgi:hypothetical protein
VADKIVDHDGMMLDEFNNVVSDLGDEMRAEMKELRAELRALVVAKVSAQEKEIRELREMVLSLAKKVDGGRLPPPHPLPPGRRGGRARTAGTIVRPSCGPQKADAPIKEPPRARGHRSQGPDLPTRRRGNPTTTATTAPSRTLNPWKGSSSA